MWQKKEIQRNQRNQDKLSELERVKSNATPCAMNNEKTLRFLVWSFSSFDRVWISSCPPFLLTSRISLYRNKIHVWISLPRRLRSELLPASDTEFRGCSARGICTLASLALILWREALFAISSSTQVASQYFRAFQSTRWSKFQARQVYFQTKSFTAVLPVVIVMVMCNFNWCKVSIASCPKLAVLRKQQMVNGLGSQIGNVEAARSSQRTMVVRVAKIKPPYRLFGQKYAHNNRMLPIAKLHAFF